MIHLDIYVLINVKACYDTSYFTIRIKYENAYLISLERSSIKNGYIDN